MTGLRRVLAHLLRMVLLAAAITAGGILTAAVIVLTGGHP